MVQAKRKNNFSQERRNFIPAPYDLVYQCFKDSGFHTQSKEFFKQNASQIAQSLRKETWKRYTEFEKTYSNHVYDPIVHSLDYGDMTPQQAILHFLSVKDDLVYDFSLSKTQSRRSRSGKEFESIIELVFMGAGIELDSQGNIASRFFTEKDLGKAVDLVIPGALEFGINKRNVALISAKTTLRERWQEVSEEMSRTGVSEMYLMTLDENISDKVLENLYESNVIVVTLKHIKEKNYAHTTRVITFEDLLHVAETKALSWKQYPYSEEEINQKTAARESQIKKHGDKDFVVSYYRSIEGNFSDS